VVVHGRS